MTKTVYIKLTMGKSLTEYLTTASVLCYQIDHPLCLHHLKTYTNDNKQDPLTGRHQVIGSSPITQQND